LFFFSLENGRFCFPHRRKSRAQNLPRLNKISQTAKEHLPMIEILRQAVLRYESKKAIMMATLSAGGELNTYGINYNNLVRLPVSIYIYGKTASLL
jgi:hypothetical protein